MADGFQFIIIDRYLGLLSSTWITSVSYGVIYFNRSSFLMALSNLLRTALHQVTLPAAQGCNVFKREGPYLWFLFKGGQVAHEQIEENWRQWITSWETHLNCLRL